MKLRHRAAKLLLAVVLTAGAAVAAPLATATPAQALGGNCPTWLPPNGSWHGPYWWGAVDASQKAGHRMVLDIQGPWFGNGVEVHLWQWQNTQNQYWCLGNSYYNSAIGAEAYEIVNAYTDQCLTATGTGNGALVQQFDCDGSGHQLWLQVSEGTRTVLGTSTKTYEFKNEWAGGCLDVRDFGSSNGSVEQIWSCSGGLNQRWF